MKKITLIIIMSLIFIIQVNLANVHADAMGTSMGFDIDTTQYGDYVDEHDSVALTYYEKGGSYYLVGWSRLETAVYADQTDDDYALVIAKSHTEPKNVKIPVFLGLKVMYVSVTNEVNYHSDIDGSFYYTYYGDYYSNSGFTMSEPQPMITPQTDYYTLSVEISGTPKVSASTTFEINELDFSFDHSGYQEIYDVTYKYNCNLSSCDYATELTYNRGLFIVDMTAGYNGNTGDFLNVFTLTTSFYDRNSNFISPPQVSSSIVSTLYY
jgi:hypothetical protein